MARRAKWTGALKFRLPCPVAPTRTESAAVRPVCQLVSVAMSLPMSRIPPAERELNRDRQCLPIGAGVAYRSRLAVSCSIWLAALKACALTW